MKIKFFSILFIVLILLVSCDKAIEPTNKFPSQNVYNVKVPEMYYMFQDDIAKVIEEYNKGELGEEFFYLTSYNGWLGWEKFAIAINGDTAQLIYYPSETRSKTRQLTQNEIKQFLNFISQNKVDMFKDLNKIVNDATEYQYLHCSKGKANTFHMSDPEKKDGLYYTLVELFRELA